MGPEQPIHVRIRGRSRWLARLWVVGDLAYYLGLVCAVAAFSMIFAIFLVGGLADLFRYADKVQHFWQLLPICYMALPLGIATAVAAGFLKAIAYRRSGIDRNAPGEFIPEERT